MADDDPLRPPPPNAGFLNPNTPDWELIATRLRTALEQIVYIEGINPAAYKIARDALKRDAGR